MIDDCYKVPKLADFASLNAISYYMEIVHQLIGKTKCGVIAGIPNDTCSPLQRCLRSRYPDIYTQPGRGPNFLAIVRENYVFIMSIVISKIVIPMFFLPSVADDDGIDIDLL